MIALKILAIWCASSVVVGALFCAAITRGKMDSHRRQHGAGDGDPFGSRGGSQRGPNIDHSTSV